MTGGNRNTGNMAGEYDADPISPEAVMAAANNKLLAPKRGIAAAAAATAVLSSFLFGYQTVVLVTCSNLIAVVMQWCGNDWESTCSTGTFNIGLLSSLVYLGAAVGAFLSGRPWVFGRGSRFQLMLSDVLFVIGGVFYVFGQDLVSLLAGRAISGVALGLCGIAAPMYIAEVSPRELRGVFSAFHGVGITVGILVATSLGLPQSPPPSGPDETLQGVDFWYWRFLLGFQMVPALLQLAMFLRVVPIDPPSFLIMCSLIEEEKDLDKARKLEDQARTLMYRTYAIDLPSREKDPNGCSWESLQLEIRINDLKEAAESARATPPIKVHQAMCDPFFRCALLIGFGLAAFQQLSGINALMGYSIVLFREGGIPSSCLTIASTGMSMANVCASFLSSKLVDNLGRRVLLLGGSLGQAFAMGVLTFCVSSASSLPPVLVGACTVIAFTLFVTTFSAGLGAITWLYLAEIYPQEIRGNALSACGVLNWLCSFAMVFLAGFLNLKQTCALFFWISFVGSIGVYYWVIETKGCSMDDSPLTPRSGRSSSTLLTPNANSPKMTDYMKMEDEENDSDIEELTVNIQEVPGRKKAIGA
jgi:MFS family permease